MPKKRIVFWPKLAKIANFEVFSSFLSLNMTSITKNDKTIIMRDKYFDVLGKSREKFFGTTLSVYPLWSHTLHRKICIFGHIAKMATFQNEVAQIQIFFNFLKLSHLSSNIQFLSREAIKTR